MANQPNDIAGLFADHAQRIRRLETRPSSARGRFDGRVQPPGVVYADGIDSLATDPDYLLYDDTNKRLHVGTIPVTPTTSTLNVYGDTTLTGNLLFTPDDTYSIGASMATRPQKVYISDNAYVGPSSSFTDASLFPGVVEIFNTGATNSLQIKSDNASGGGVGHIMLNSTADASPTWYMGRARGTGIAPANTASGDTLGSIIFLGWSNAFTPTFTQAARIIVKQDGAPTPHVPGRIEFYTNDGVNDVPDRKWIINATGHVLADTDNSWDIGQPGANRPRCIYVANCIVAPNITASSGFTVSGLTADRIVHTTTGGTLATDNDLTYNATTNLLTTAGQIQSTLATGTAPFIVASTTLVTNLNADLLDGLSSAAFVQHSLADAKGDLLAASAADTIIREAVGADGTFYTADSAQATGHAWVTHGNSGDPHSQYLLESIFAAKGDILGATANDTPAILSVGTDGQFLVAASGQATGLQWTTHDATGDPHTQYVLVAGDTMTGNLLFSADNTHNIGAAGATRPNTLHVGTKVIIGDNASSGGRVNLPNNTSIQWRNAANSADLVGLVINTSDLLNFSIGTEFTADVTIGDSTNIILGTTGGTKIGTATSQKLGFYNASPVDQPSHIADPSGGLTADSQARTAINAILDLLQELGLMAP